MESEMKSRERLFRMWQKHVPELLSRWLLREHLPSQQVLQLQRPVRHVFLLLQYYHQAARLLAWRQRLSSPATAIATATAEPEPATAVGRLVICIVTINALACDLLACPPST